MSMFELFETNPALETEGVWIDYGDFRVKVGRAGGANKKYLSFAELKTKPFRRAIQAGTMPEERSRSLIYEIYARAVILDWQVADGEEGKWKSGIPKKDGGSLDFTEQNVIDTFKQLPALFTDIQQCAEGIALFRKEEMEADAKN